MSVVGHLIRREVAVLSSDGGVFGSGEVGGGAGGSASAGERAEGKPLCAAFISFTFLCVSVVLTVEIHTEMSQPGLIIRGH